MSILVLALALMAQPATEYNGIHVTMDGCIPCQKLHNETDKDLDKYVVKHKIININHFEKDIDKKLIKMREVKYFPTFLIFKKIGGRNIYIGRVEGYMPAEEFFGAIEEVKIHSGKYKTDIVIRRME